MRVQRACEKRVGWVVRKGGARRYVAHPFIAAIHSKAWADQLPVSWDCMPSSQSLIRTSIFPPAVEQPKRPSLVTCITLMVTVGVRTVISLNLELSL